MEEKSYRKYIESLDSALRLSILNITNEIREMQAKKEELIRKQNITFSLLKKEISEDVFDELLNEMKNWD